MSDTIQPIDLSLTSFLLSLGYRVHKGKGRNSGRFSVDDGDKLEPTLLALYKTWGESGEIVCIYYNTIAPTESIAKLRERVELWEKHGATLFGLVKRREIRPIYTIGHLFSL